MAKQKINSSQIVEEAWIAPTFLNNWVNYGAGYPNAAYMKDSSGFVNLKGLVKSGTTTDNVAIFNLPAGYRPAAILHLVAVGSGGPGHIKANTTSVAYGSVTGNGWLSLDGIRFKAEQ